MNLFHAALTPTRSRRLNELVGLVLLACAVLLSLALVSYHAGDPSLNTAAGHAARNWIGIAGAAISDVMLQLVGVTAFCLPLLITGLGWNWLMSRATPTIWAKWLGAALWLVFAPALLALLPWHLRLAHAIPIEGVTGRLLADLLVAYLNYPGAMVVTLAFAGIAIYLTTTFSFARAHAWAAVHFAFVQAWRDRWRNWRAAKSLAREQKRRATSIARQAREMNKAAGRSEARSSDKARFQIDDMEAPVGLPIREDSSEPPVNLMPPDLPIEPLHSEARPSVWSTVPRAQVPLHKAPAAKPEPAAPPTRSEKAAAKKTALESTAFDDLSHEDSIAVGERADAMPKNVTVTPKSAHGFRLPPTSLLHRSEDTTTVREDELREQARILIEKCGEFGVTGQVVQINPGPVVTTFEFKPEAGIKYSRVTGLADDLCLAMRAESILIERMAGKSTVGIQVPNLERETIWLRDVAESPHFTDSRSRLTLAMGKDINGRIVTTDLAAMPHVLIAGSTGSGKSVAINAMIMSLLLKATPAEVRLILVDPKRVELGMYEGVPHLFTPIITEPKLAANALRNAVREMERRLKLLASRSVRNIDQYNRLFDANTPSLFEATDDQQPLPYIVIIIDELADLMMLDKANVEESITRLAQMARAVGIHLVLATQRPSVDVITGLIKANVPTRISFRLSTKVDSRTILDSNGAEALLGRGDMLFLPPGTSRLKRVHAPFVTEKEIAAIVDYWKEQGQAEYVQGFLESPRDEKGRELDSEIDGDGAADEMFEDAVRLVLEFGKASTSLLQRRLRIGYGRAAHLIDMMERDGIVGSADGSKPREILKPPDWLNEVESVLR